MMKTKKILILVAMVLCTAILFQETLTTVWASSIPDDMELENEIVSSFPTGMIKLDDTHFWTTLNSDALYDLPLEKNADTQPMISILASDNDNDIKSIEYFVATDAFIEQMDLSEGLDAAIGDNWILAKDEEGNITDEVLNIPLTEYGKTFVYAKITDAANNITYLNSTGIILCTQPSVPEEPLYYEISNSNNLSFQVELNGHYIEDIILMDSLGSVVTDFILDESEDWAYRIDGDGTIELNHNFFKELNVNETYCIEIKYVPLTERCEGNGADIEAENSKVQLTILDRSNWGTPVTQSNQVVQYVDDSGKTSVAIDSENFDSSGILWLLEESNGSQSWYGIDLSDSGIELDVGSRFYVRWLKSDEEKYQDLYDMLDETHKASIDEDSCSIFQIGIEDREGNKIEFKQPITTYVEIGSDWNKEEICAYYISAETDEDVSVDFTEYMGLPMGVLELKHFSPYIIYSKGSEMDEEVTPPNENEPIITPPIEDEQNITSPETGDNSVDFILERYMYILVGLGILGVLYKKRF